MNAAEDLLTDAVARARRRPPQRWLMRGAMLLCGVAAQLWLTWLGVAPVMQALAWTALLAGAVFPRTPLPLVAGALIVFESAAVGLSPLEAVPVALGLAGWHLSAVALTTGRPWARLSPRVVRAMWMPGLVGLAGIAVAVPVALLANGLVLPEIAVITLLLVLAVVLGAVIALWPAADARE